MTQRISDSEVIAGRIGPSGNPLRRQEFGEPAAALGPGWRCLVSAIFHARGEAGMVDLVALNPERGVVLVAFLAEGEVASPGEARDAFRAMLEDAGFYRQFPGDLPIAAFALSAIDSDRLTDAISRTFATASPPTVGKGWDGWLAARLMPARAPETEPARPRLVVASPDEAPAAPTAQPPADTGPSADSTPRVDRLEPPLSSPAPRQRKWRLGLVLAVGVLMALLAGLAMMVRAGRLPLL